MREIWFDYRMQTSNNIAETRITEENSERKLEIHKN